VHFHWEGGGQPSAIAIAGQPLPPQHVIDAVYQRAVLREDCAAIGAAQRRVEAALRKARCESGRRSEPTCASAWATGR